MADSGDKSNDPFQKGDPFKNKSYNKLFVQLSFVVIAILLLGLLFIYMHGRHT